MKLNAIILSIFGMAVCRVVALEPPQKVEPLAPNLATAESPTDQEASAKPQHEEDKQVQNALPAPEDKAYMGIGVTAVPPALAAHLGLSEDACALVRLIDPKGPAAKSGIEESDVVTQVDGQVIKCHDCLCDVLEKHKPGDEVKISVIHRGQLSEKVVSLARCPAEQVAGFEDCKPPAEAVPENLLGALPKEMRDAIEKNLKALDIGGNAGAAAGVQVLPGAELKGRVEKMMMGGNLKMLQMQPGGRGQIHMGMKSSINMMDGEGRIEITRDGDSTEAKVFDRDGNLQWSGPYQTQQDKAAVPPQVRDRLDALNINLGGNNGIELRIQPQALPER